MQPLIAICDVPGNGIATGWSENIFSPKKNQMVSGLYPEFGFEKAATWLVFRE